MNINKVFLPLTKKKKSSKTEGGRKAHARFKMELSNKRQKDPTHIAFNN
jgi:hypothetical protein